jgi:large subunit ribosomal protein L3
MVETAAEHEVVEQVTPEQQAELLKTQEAGAEAAPEATETTTEGGEAGSDESKES